LKASGHPSFFHKRKELFRIHVSVLLFLLFIGLGSAQAETPDGPAGQMLAMINQFRKLAALGEVRWSMPLAAVADSMARDLARSDHLAHQDGSGAGLKERLAKVHYAYRVAAENLAAGSSDPHDTLEDWLHSPPHRRNLEDPRVQEAGIGYRPAGRLGPLWVLILATPVQTAPDEPAGGG
jgi:uncharacterized protein YkwD